MIPDVDRSTAGRDGQVTQAAAPERRWRMAARWAAGLAAVPAGLLLGGYVLTAFLCRPSSDDFALFNKVRALGAWGLVAADFQTNSARWANELWIAWSFKLFGDRAAQVVPLSILVVLCLGAYLMARHAFPAGRAPAAPLRAALALVAVAVGIVTTPSVLDSYLWLSSAIGYTGGLGVTLVAAAVFLNLLRRPAGGVRAWEAVGCLALVALAQGFTEAQSAANLALVTLLAVVRAVRRRRGHWGLIAVSWAVLLAGTLLMALAPGARARAAVSNVGITPAEQVTRALRDLPVGYRQFFAFVDRSDAVLLLGLALLVAAFLAGQGGRACARTLALGAGMALLPSAAYFATVLYARGAIDVRTFAFASPLIAWGLALAAGSLPGLVIAVVRRSRSDEAAFGPSATPSATPFGRSRATVTWAAFAVVELVFGAVLAAPDALALVKAEALRAQMVDFRDRVVRLAEKQGWEQIPVFPAPFEYAPSGASDFQFSQDQIYDWFGASYRDYMRVPADAVLVPVTEQPPGYCTAIAGQVKDIDASNLTCRDLAAAWLAAYE
jgi:hypothetical protein